MQTTLRVVLLSWICNSCGFVLFNMSEDVNVTKRIGWTIHIIGYIYFWQEVLSSRNLAKFSSIWKRPSSSKASLILSLSWTLSLSSTGLCLLTLCRCVLSLQCDWSIHLIKHFLHFSDWSIPGYPRPRADCSCYIRLGARVTTSLRSLRLRSNFLHQWNSFSWN